MLSRMGYVLLDQDSLTGNVYNMQFCSSVTTYHNRLLAVAWMMIQAETFIIDGTFMPIDDREELHRREVLSHTLSRGFQFVRARLGETDGRGEDMQEQSMDMK